MRLIYDKTTKIIQGVIAERVTNHIPPSYINENSTFVDIDYNEKSLRRSVLAKTLEREGVNLVGKTLVFKGQTVTFKDARPKQYMDTVMVDLEDPKLHKDVDIYSEKAKVKGVTVEFDDIDSAILVRMNHKDRLVGTIRLEKRGCCTYVYQEGKVEDRAYYPHYIGFSEIIKYLQKKQMKWLDMNGFVKKDGDLNRFKRKWGKTMAVEVTWQ